MVEFFEGMDVYLRTLWFMALPASLIFLIQSIMTIVGMDWSGDSSADFDGNLDGSTDTPFQFFSFRNLINFFLGYGWAGISFYGTIENKIILTLVAFLVGLLFVALFFIIIRQLQRLAEDNTAKPSDTINQTGTVYIPIPAAKSGSGKVQISIRGAFHEMDAITMGERLETGIMVKVIALEGETVLLVEKIN
ncbi:MAG: serine protease [Bacteroidetes bacterium HGW-Bacteroidetes-21]|jgi:hypothetical protein|nr:MAG: serine protease [Bacteroidetes bacterium HGW-Bacteroidetes-21]